MKPRLVSLDGPLRGQVFALRAPECVVGRDSDADIELSDQSVSRRHCLLRGSQDGRTEIADQESRNGTFVNGVPVTSRVLEHGDEVRVGSSHFVFLSDEEGGDSRRAAPKVRCGNRRCDRLLRIAPRELLHPKPGGASGATAGFGQVAHNLRVLLQITAAARVTAGPDELAGSLLEAVAQAIPAAEGSLTLFDDAVNVEWSGAWRREGGRREAVSLPMALARQVVVDDVAILAHCAAGESGEGGSRAEEGANACVLAPLRISEGRRGVLYFAAEDPVVVFDGHDLQLVTAVATIAGPALEAAMRVEWLAAENRLLIDECLATDDMIGESPAMADVFRFVALAARADSNVMITGPSGTGKELVALAIHRRSRRARGAWVAVNCAALPEALLESELFGHERGSFTGAVARKLGKFEMASGGTLFLDEIGDMSPPLQAKMLRALQSGEFDRVGGTHPVKVDVRVIAATNQDLAAAMREGRFRQDLFFRLNVLSVRLPALTERREDIPLLAQYFVARYSAATGRRVASISRSAMRSLLRHDWPGNVRELQNVIERAVVLGATPEILYEDLPQEFHHSGSQGSEDGGTGYHRSVREAKRMILREAIARAGGNQAEAARRLGLNPTYLSRLVKQLGLKDGDAPA